MTRRHRKGRWRYRGKGSLYPLAGGIYHTASMLHFCGIVESGAIVAGAPARAHPCVRPGFECQSQHEIGNVIADRLPERRIVQQPSTDLARYQELAPENLRYDLSSKAYHATTDFTPRLAKPDARSYLTQLLMLADQGISQDASWIGFVPAHAVVPRVRRRLDAKTLRPIVNAIHQKRSVFISYQSMNNPAPTSRWIDPHALVFDGARWHVRAWCHKRSHFSDFVLARVLAIIDTRPSEAPNSSLDREWHEHVEVRLAPNPSLTEAQKRAVEYDYGKVGGEISVRMRIRLT